jgi:hypothetical protein
MPDLPGIQSLLQVDTSGNLAATNTLASNLNLTLQGTGQIAHGLWSRRQTIRIDKIVSGTPSAIVEEGKLIFARCTSGDAFYFELRNPPAPEQLDHVALTCNRTAGNGVATYDLLEIGPTGSLTSILSSPVVGASSAQTITPNLFPSVGAATFLHITMPSDNITSFEYFYLDAYYFKN